MKTKLLLFFTALFISSTLSAQIWTEKATQFTTSHYANHIAIVNDNIIWICSDDYNQVNQFSKSVDGGNTWISGSFGLPSTFIPSSITAISGLKAWICGYDNTTSIVSVYITTDGGTTWVQQTTAFSNDLNTFPDHIHFFNDNNGIAIGDGNSSFEIYRTSNGGITWTRVPNANLPSVLTSYEVTINSMEYFDYTADGSTIWLGTQNGSIPRLYKSVDFGVTWTATALNFDAGYSGFSFTFKNANEGYLIGKIAGVFKLQKTIDGGNTFYTITTNGLPTTISYPSIKSIPGTNTLIFTDKSTVGSYYSTDLGANWHQFGNQTKVISSLAFNNATTGFAGTINNSSTSGGIFKYSTFPVISLIGPATPAQDITTDYDMTTVDGINYTFSNIFLSFYSLKFRKDHDWTVNWANASFPTGTGIQNGTQIPINQSGYYNVSLNIVTGDYSFTYLSPPPTISLIGSNIGTAWTSDVDLTTNDGYWYIINNYNFNQGEAKFRQNHAWMPSSFDWGSTDFPSGNAVLGGPNIPITSGVYDVIFNRITGYYQFNPSLSINENKLNEIVLFPNPVIDILNIKISNNDLIKKIIVTDLTSKKVLEQSNNANQVNVANLAKGLYVVEAFSGEEKFVQKFIKE